MPIPGNLLSSTTESVDPNTSGWTAKLNATLLLGTNGRNGPGALTVRSVAAGEAQARTVAAVPVTAGVEYSAFADASTPTVPERIGIRWLDAASAELGITWSLVAAWTSTLWHRIAVAGIAPPGATQAQIVLSMMTPAAAGVVTYFENVYFGPPIRTTGNLFDYNTESIERDATGWVAESNTTVTRTQPALQWPVDYYLAGGHTLAVTAVANGNASVRTAEQAAATPGRQYLGYCYISPPTSGSSCWVELRFYDATHTLIGSPTRATMASPGVGPYRQKVSAYAPTGTAYVALAAGITSATAGQVMRVDSAVVTSTIPTREGSVVPYADSSFEQGVAGWTVVSGVATLARLTPWGTDALEGSYSMTVTSSTATTSVIRSARFPLGSGVAGREWTAEIGARVTAGAWNFTRIIRWYDASAVEIGATTVASAPIPTPNWWLLRVSGNRPVGATQAAIEWTLAATSASSVLRLDTANLWESLPLTGAVSHHDDAYIELTARELLLDTYLTVWRVGPDGKRTFVRGASGLLDRVLITSDVLVVEDYEAPLGVAVRYEIEMRDAAGVLQGNRSIEADPLDPGDGLMCWIKDPGLPQFNCRAMVARVPEWTRPIEQVVHRPRGRSRPVVRSQVRGDYEGQLGVWTRTDDETDALNRVLDSGGVIFLQFAPGWHESDRYVSVGETPLPRAVDDGEEEWRVWTLPLITVDMPTTLGIAGSAGRTWQDILTEFATWQDVESAYATWLDVLLNRRL
ncbi:hypothetical protein VWBp48 [Streptomyces phage VWB]|uniref:Minor tail protein n=1 Tax=Streptomyces phage VWB TaxID=10702 RepID=Q6VY41_9CAUD|nr:hypothetical protein VWBp48 [Streptomyces phage VWB]AAR29751.1 hypothetical protein [Streptomyces phage VWB]